MILKNLNKEWEFLQPRYRSKAFCGWNEVEAFEVKLEKYLLKKNDISVWKIKRMANPFRPRGLLLEKRPQE